MTIVPREGLRLNNLSEKKELLLTKPTPHPRVAKSMFYLLSRTNPEIPGTNPEGFAEARFIDDLESSGFFEEMNRHYEK